MVNDWPSFLQKIEDGVSSGKEISFNDALALTDLPDELIDNLARIANRVRQNFSQNKVDLCSIINARSGQCTEDCKFCTQSAHHKTNPPTYPMKSVTEIVEAAKNAEKAGAKRFCIVTSGGELSDEDFNITLEATNIIAKQTKLSRCASLGKLNKERAAKLKEAGLNRYHHNTETASSFFGDICSTHSHNEKLETIENLQEAGIETCVGGILNMGESPKQRIEFAFELKKINPVSVPINFLNPREGTPLENQKPISALEAAKYLAIFRLILPNTYLRLAGGRIETFGDNQELALKSGVNALLIGDLLTTKGPETQSDLKLLESMKFEL